MKVAVVMALAIAAAMPGAGPPVGSAAQATARTTRSCFLLLELGQGEVAREPSEACALRMTPASTSKVPHALAALDAGVAASVA